MTEPNPSGIDNKPNLPATLRLHRELDKKIQELGSVATEKYTQHNGHPPAGDDYAALDVSSSPFPLKVGEVDHVLIESLTRRDDGTIAVGLHLFSAGSPYNLPAEQDIKSPITYDLIVIRGEYPPFIAYIDAVDEGADGTPNYIEYLKNGGVDIDGLPLDPPLILSEEGCQQFIDDILPQLTTDKVVTEI